MNEKQRIKNCIHFKNIDKMPWQINYASEIVKNIMQSLNIKEPEYIVLSKNIFKYSYLDDFFGNHIVYLRNGAVNSVVEIKPDIWRDEWAVLWDRRLDKDIGVPVNCLLENMQLKDIIIPDPDDPDRYAHFWPLIKSNPQRYLLVKFSYRLFERAWSLRGMENLMMDFIDNPSFVHELLSAITEFNLKILKNLKNFPVDGVQFGDDWGGQRGLLMGPNIWRKFIKPYLIKMYDQAHIQGYDVIIHSCGDITAVLDDLIEIGVNVFNPFQPEVMDIEDIIDRYSHRLAFYGGLIIQKTLPFGKPNEIKQEVRHRLKLAHRYNGFIISPSHDMPTGISLDNVLSMLKTIK